VPKPAFQKTGKSQENFPFQSAFIGVHLQFYFDSSPRLIALARNMVVMGGIVWEGSEVSRNPRQGVSYRRMKKRYAILGLVVLVLSGLKGYGPLSGIVGLGEDKSIASAFQNHQSGVQVTGEGVVLKVLPDDTDGSRHQRFILKLSSGQSILIAHNIDLAPRIPALKVGEQVAFHGVYEWSAEGGVVHWTHDDPSGRHTAGWVRRR
jgi:hypothetical protein